MHTQSTYDRDSLLLAAGQLSGVVVFALFQSDPLQKLECLLFCFRLRPLLYFDRGKRDIVQHRFVRKQVIALEHHSDLLAHLADQLRILPDFISFQQDLPALDILQRIDASEQRALSAARGADDHYHFPLLHRQADIIQNHMIPIRFMKMRDFQYCIVLSHFPPSL